MLCEALCDRASHLDHLAHTPFQPGRIRSRRDHFFGFAFFTADLPPEKLER
jgi:hypothetical protein